MEQDKQTARRLREEARERFMSSPEGTADQFGRARQSVLMAFAGEPATSRAWNVPRAIDEYGTVIRYSPDRKDALIERGLFQLITGRPEGALADFTAYLTLAPDAPYVHYLRARSLTKLGREAEGASDLQFWRDHQLRPEAITPLRELPALPRTTRNMSGLDAMALTQHKDAWKIPIYAEILLSTRSDVVAYDAAVEGLRQFDAQELLPVVKQIETGVALGLDKRGSAMALLGKIQSPSSIPYLLAAARYGAEVIPQTALYVLAKFPKEEAAPALQKLILSLPDDRLSEQAATSLGQLDYEAARDFFEKVILTGTRQDQIRVTRFLNAPSGSALAMLTLMEIVDDTGTERSLREAAGKAFSRNSSFAQWVEERLRQA